MTKNVIEIEDENKQFTTGLDGFVQEQSLKFFSSIKEFSLIGCQLFISVPQEFLDVFGLTNIKFYVSFPGCQMHYLYNDYDVEPICHYIQEKSFRKVATLEILREAIAKNTHKPNIMHLELVDSK